MVQRRTSLWEDISWNPSSKQTRKARARKQDNKTKETNKMRSIALHSILIIGALGVAHGQTFGGNNDPASVSGELAATLGGQFNIADGNLTTVVGGLSNHASGLSSAIIGAESSQTLGEAAIVAGGYANTASGKNSAAIGGNFNRAVGRNSFATGTNSLANADFSTAIGYFAIVHQTGHQGAVVISGLDPNAAEGSSCTSTSAGSVTMCATNTITMNAAALVVNNVDLLEEIAELQKAIQDLKAQIEQQAPSGRLLRA